LVEGEERKKRNAQVEGLKKKMAESWPAIYLILLYGAFPILLHGRFVDRARETDILMPA
jgi:hypothetical protein